MTTKKTGAKSRTAPEEATDRKTLATGDRPETQTAAGTSSTGAGRRPWKKKSVAEHILGQIDKLREEVEEKHRTYLEAKTQLDKLEQLRQVLENQ